MTENQEHRNILEVYRREHGLSIVEMARKAGVKESTLATHLYGTRKAKAGMCAKYATVFKLKLNDVIESIGSPA
jgi:DNA-binding XRE family transcriptional regulator